MKSSGPRIDPCGTPQSTFFFQIQLFLFYYIGVSLSDRVTAFSVPFLGVRSVHTFSAVAHCSLYQYFFRSKKVLLVKFF